jgi:hypothetical protein
MRPLGLQLKEFGKFTRIEPTTLCAEREEWGAFGGVFGRNVGINPWCAKPRLAVLSPALVVGGGWNLVMGFGAQGGVVLSWQVWGAWARVANLPLLFRWNLLVFCHGLRS